MWLFTLDNEVPGCGMPWELWWLDAATGGLQEALGRGKAQAAV